MFAVGSEMGKARDTTHKLLLPLGKNIYNHFRNLGYCCSCAKIFFSIQTHFCCYQYVTGSFVEFGPSKPN